MVSGSVMVGVTLTPRSTVLLALLPSLTSNRTVRWMKPLGLLRSRWRNDRPVPTATSSTRSPSRAEAHFKPKRRALASTSTARPSWKGAMRVYVRGTAVLGSRARRSPADASVDFSRAGNIRVGLELRWEES